MLEDVPNGLEQPVDADRLVVVIARLGCELFSLGVEVVLPPKVLLNLLRLRA